MNIHIVCIMKIIRLDHKLQSVSKFLTVCYEHLNWKTVRNYERVVCDSVLVHPFFTFLLWTIVCLKGVIRSKNTGKSGDLQY